MFNQSASFSCTALVGTNKAGILKPNADGYYTLVIGALDVYNSGGAYYPYGPAKALFTESSSFMRRIASGALRGECGHPRMTPGMSMRDYMSRILDIYEPNTCCHFRKVWLDFDQVKDAQGRKVIAIMAEVKPSGPMGPALKEALDNPSENVCFSIRSLTNDIPVGSTIHKHLKTIVTFDWVNEPGISVAKKWHSPALESLEQDIPILPIHLTSMLNRPASELIAMESNGGLTPAQILRDLGWDEESVKGRLAAQTPVSQKW